MLRCFTMALLFAAAAVSQCNVTAVVTAPAGVNTTCWNPVQTTVSAALTAPCQLGVPVVATNSVWPVQPTFALLVLGDTPGTTPVPGLPGCPLFTNPLVTLLQSYTPVPVRSGTTTFTFTIPMLVLPLTLYAQAATLSWYSDPVCPRGCGYFVIMTSDGLQITLQ